MGHRSFKRVDKQKHAVAEAENALHLAAEIRVSGSVHDIDRGVLIFNGRVLGKNCYAALALDVVAVHDALCHDFVGPENTALPEHSVHKSCLAVVDVRDYRYISDFVSCNNQFDYLLKKGCINAAFFNATFYYNIFKSAKQ